MAKKRKEKRPDPFEEAFRAAWSNLVNRPLFVPLAYDPTYSGLRRAHVHRAERTAVTAARGWARVLAHGEIEVNPLQRGTYEEWLWVLAHCLLHLGFGHLDGPPPRNRDEHVAHCREVVRFQEALRLGECPFEVPGGVGGDGPDIAAPPADPPRAGPPCAGPPRAGPPRAGPPPALSWSDRLSIGLADAARYALADAGELRAEHARAPDPNTPWERARRWFVSAYPLLAALAGGFTVVAERDLVRRLNISIAAVDASVAEIYVNPFAALSPEEWRFVLAHEMLHAALRHGDRVGGRDPYLWNVACDYVINGWLVEMGVGDVPDGLLYDPALTGLSAEAVYDRIARDLRRLRRLATLRGRGLGDVLTEPVRGVGDPTGLDDFYRRALTMGLANHYSQGRGLVAAGLVDEIRVLDQPPLPWDARLAKWFDEHVPAPSRQRTYARASRRQSASPDIPRPGWYLPEEVQRRATFGVVLDTSGSMDRALLGKALGAIASYALARDVPAARVVYCDAVAYDAGYVPVAEIAGRVRVRGRGGTVLQPGVRLLESASDFPEHGPILVITDGYCDVVRIRREHAFLVPAGHSLPFTPRGPVFRLR
jgi:predicted metal-dependent peptidase